MFGWDEVIKLIIASFIIFPLVSFIHLAGHIFFIGICGGREKKIVIGCGKTLFSIWKIEVKKYYFMSGGCEFCDLRWDTKLSTSLIYLGGALFNLLSILLVNSLIKTDFFEVSMFWYTFVYYSFYVIFFSLLPITYSDGSPSDGKALWLSLRNQQQDKYTDDLQPKRKNH